MDQIVYLDLSLFVRNKAQLRPFKSPYPFYRLDRMNSGLKPCQVCSAKCERAHVTAGCQVVLHHALAVTGQ